MDIENELKRAIELHQNGLKKEALAMYRLIVKQDPCHADAWHLMGLVAFDEGRLAEADELVTKAVALAPDCVLFRTNLGLILAESGNYEKALDEYLGAFNLDRNCHEASYRAALMYQNLGMNEDAFTYYEKTLVLKADHAAAWNNLGNLAMEFVRPEEAFVFFNKAVEIDPGFAEAFNNMGCLYLKLNRPDDAIPCFEKAIDLLPDFYQALNNLGNAHKKKRAWNRAAECYERALTLEPGSAETRYSLADVLRSAGLVDEAFSMFVETVDIKKDHGHALQQIVSILESWCDFERYEHYRALLKRLALKAMEENGDCPEAPFSCLGRDEDGEYARRVTAYWSDQLQDFIKKLGLVFQYDGNSEKERITLGYLSNNVKNHPNAHLVLGLFNCHDRDRFSVNVYSYGEDDGSDYRKKIEADSDLFRDIRDMSYVDAAQVIHTDGVDILIDLTGYTLGSVMEIPALRPAPVQVRYLGFPGSMQASFFDYFITDRIMTPPEDQVNYTEKFVLMPECYQINDRDQKIAPTVYTRADFGLPETGFVFCSFNSAYKIDPVMFGAWMDILKDVSGSVIWLLRENPHMETNLKAEAARQGVDESRLVFSDKMPKPEHLARLKLADLALDTRLVSGHITTSDALWAGVPVITKRGNHFISRAPASILTHIGLSELVTESLESYKNLAVSLAKEPGSLDALKKKLEANRETAPLFDTARFVRHYERALTAMWTLWMDGKKPEMIVVSTVD